MAAAYRHGMVSPVFVGFLTTMALIAAIGAQNAFVLRQGIRGEHVVPVIALCTLSDLILIAAGIAGVGALITAHPTAMTIATIGGATFLIGYGALAARRALRPSALNPAEETPVRLIEVLLTAAALTWLNPHVYLDTVVLLGSLANEYQEQRWLFGAGAVAASALWFTGLGLGARKLAGLFASASTWRILDGIIAVVMVSLGVWMAIP